MWEFPLPLRCPNLVMDSKGAAKLCSHPTPEGPFREGNDLSAVRCKSICEAKWLNGFGFSIHASIRSRHVASEWLSFYRTTRYHISGQQYIKVIFYSSRSLTSLSAIFVRELCFSCKCSYSDRRGGLANRGDSADQQSRWTLSDMSTWH